MDTRTISLAATFLFTAIGCDAEPEAESFRSRGNHGHHGNHGQHRHHGNHGNHGSCGYHGQHCDQLDISDLLEDYDEDTNPYTDPDMWLSGPDAIEDFALTVNLDTTIVYPDLSTEVIHPERAVNPDLDIFFVHPTVNLSSAPGNDDLSDLTNTESFVAESAARFSTIGRVIAPLYHSVTAGVFFLDEEASEDYFEIAYQDVEDAFSHYLANHWNGRKLVIMGWSQGGIMTRMLMQRFIAGHPDLMSRVVAVMPIGADIQQDSFDDFGPCETPEQTGCYIAYNSFLEGDGPQADTVIGGWAATATTACTNVAGALGDEGTFSMSYFSVPQAPGQLPSDALADLPVTIDTPFMAFPAFYSGACVSEGGRYVEVSQTNPGGDSRWTPIDYSDPFVVTSAPFGLGLHIFDYSIAMGDLLDLVALKASGLEDETEFCVER